MTASIHHLNLAPRLSAVPGGEPGIPREAAARAKSREAANFLVERGRSNAELTTPLNASQAATLSDRRGSSPASDKAAESILPPIDSAALHNPWKTRRQWGWGE